MKLPSVSFSLLWRGVLVQGTYDARPWHNRSDRVFLEAAVPLFADGACYLVKWFGPLDAPLSEANFADLSEGWLDEAAEDRGFHADDLARRQLPLF